MMKQTEAAKTEQAEREIEARLLELLQDFAGGDATSYADEGIIEDDRGVRHGLILRMFVGDTPIEVDVSIRDITAERQQTESHYTDADCQPFLANDECRVCRVYHGEPCPSCNRRGYHSDGCDTNRTNESRRIGAFL